MGNVNNFINILQIIGAISFLIIGITIISVIRSRKKNKITPFEGKVFILVAFILCAGATLLYIFSNLELFQASLG